MKITNSVVKGVFLMKFAKVKKIIPCIVIIFMCSSVTACRVNSSTKSASTIESTTEAEIEKNDSDNNQIYPKLYVLKARILLLFQIVI